MGARRRRNNIPRLRGMNGEWITIEWGIVEEVRMHFDNAFTNEHIESSEGLLECIPSQVTT